MQNSKAHIVLTYLFEITWENKQIWGNEV